MWAAFSNSLSLSESSSLGVGSVNVSAENGIALTFGVEKFPTLLLISADGRVYEDTSRRRSIPGLRAFALGGYKATLSYMDAPTTLLDNVPVWWLILRSLWKPLKTALGLALAIAACIAGLIKWLAWYFEVGDDELVSKVDEGAVARIKARRAKDTKMETKVD